MDVTLSNDRFVVSAVKADGQAEMLGVKCGDCVTTVNGVPVEQVTSSSTTFSKVHAFASYVKSAGFPVEFSLLREPAAAPVLAVRDDEGADLDATTLSRESELKREISKLEEAIAIARGRGMAMGGAARGSGVAANGRRGISPVI